MSTNVKKQQPQKRKQVKSVPPKSQAKPKQKKRNNGKNSKKKMNRAAAIAKGQLITPVTDLKLASGVLATINVDVILDLTSFSFIPVGLVSLALTRDSPDPYAIYEVIYQDIQSIINGGTGTAPVRLDFANQIYGALAPKTVPYRRDGEISYVIQGVSDAIPGPSLTTDGGLEFYMYLPANVIVNGWNTQSPPPAYSTQQQAQAYLKAMQNLAGKSPHRVEVRNVQLGGKYIKDTSAFARNSSYYGQGAGLGAPYSSVENEVPFKSKMLSTLVKFEPSTPRASRVLDFSSGDSCSNWSFGALDQFPNNYYRGAVPPIYKFLDIDELICCLGLIWQQATQLFLSQFGSDQSVINEILGGMGMPWSTFRIMVRQQLLWMFADSQNLAQFICPETSNGGFQSFLCGSNTYPKNPNIVMNIPLVLNENLRMLKLAVRPYETAKYPSPNNHITHVPVWGAFKNTVPINFSNTYGDVTYFMFTPEPVSVPSIFDGTMGNDVADFNNTSMLSQCTATWNEFMMLVNNVIGETSPMGGEGNGSPLLQFTRYVSWRSQGIEVVGKVPRSHRQYVTEVEVDVPQGSSTTSLLDRKSSLKNVKMKKQIYNPPSSTIVAEYSVFYSGMVPITSSHKTFFPHLILPVIELVANALPTTTQVQSATLEPFGMASGSPSTNFNARYDEIHSSITDHVVGLAGKKSELGEFVGTLSKANQGGFLGDLFATVGNVSSGLGFGGIGAIANTASGVANMFGV